MALILSFFAIGLVWAFVSEFIIIMVLRLGKVEITGKRWAKTLFRWTLFALGELNLALVIALVWWFGL